MVKEGWDFGVRDAKSFSWYSSVMEWRNCEMHFGLRFFM